MQPSRSRRRCVAFPATIACLLALAVPSVAFADTSLGTAGTVTYMTNTTGSFQDSFGSVAVECPQALALTGGGGDAVSNGFGGAILIAFPGDDDDSDLRSDDRWTVDVINPVMDSFAQAWAFCTPGPSKLRVTTLQVGADRSRAARAQCPAGARVTGGGAFAFGGDLAAHWINASHPYDDGDAGTRPEDGWRALVYNDNSAAASMNVYALCRETAVRYLSATGGLGSSGASGEQESPPCPNTEHVAGAGAKLAAPERRSRIGGIVPTDDSVEAGTLPDDYVVASATNSSPQSAQLTAFAICTP